MYGYVRIRTILGLAQAEPGWHCACGTGNAPSVSLCLPSHILLSNISRSLLLQPSYPFLTLSHSSAIRNLRNALDTFFLLANSPIRLPLSTLGPSQPHGRPVCAIAATAQSVRLPVRGLHDTQPCTAARSVALPLPSLLGRGGRFKGRRNERRREGSKQRQGGKGIWLSEGRQKSYSRVKGFEPVQGSAGGL